MQPFFLRIGLFALLAGAQSAAAFPSWMGIYGNHIRHDDQSNPGRFSILMNEDYVGLQADVGIQVNGGEWSTHSIQYAGNVDGNSYWTFTPAEAFPGGATVKYYFHGFDGTGSHIYDSRNGLNYEFTTSPEPDPVVSQIDHGTWVSAITGNGITVSEDMSLWVDFRIRNIGSPMAIGILWTWNGWEDWRSTSASFEAELEGDLEQWGVDLDPAGIKYSHRSLGFIRWYPEGSEDYMEVPDERMTLEYAIFYQVGGTWFWDNNGGENYQVTIGEDTGDPNDTDADGLPDEWEQAHFGNLSQGPTRNPDGDGTVGIPMDNIIEYATGNDPNLPNDPMGVRLLWNESYPYRGSTVTLSYFAGNEGNPLFGKPVYAHVGHNGWEAPYDTAELQYNGQTGRLETSVTVPDDATELNVVFTDLNGAWDNNNGRDWTIPVRP